MYYFASDMHLGLHCVDNRERELNVVKWLDMVAQDAKAIYLVGDIFDFWFEYKRVVPKGLIRVLGKIAELTDRGVEIHFFTGNHDMWVTDYFEKECGMIVHREELLTTILGKQLLIRHGDAVLVTSLSLKLLTKVFHSELLRRWFSTLVHPNLALKFGQWWSYSSRHSKSISHTFNGESEYLVRYSREVLKCNKIDYFIFGHTHCAEIFQLNKESKAIFLGEWLESPTYARMDCTGIQLLKIQ